MQIVNVAQSVTSFKYDASTAKKQNPNRKRRWLIPLLILAQVAFKVCSHADGTPLDMCTVD